MNELSAMAVRFADEHLQPFRIKANGTEIIPMHCPFCKGGGHGDQDTFALNLESGLYVCKRGSCGARGRLTTLMKHFGEEAAVPFIGTGRLRKTYTLPDTELLALTPEITTYFDKRRISEAALEAYGIGADEHGNIVFPFYRDGTLVYTKFRRPRKPKGNEPKEWQTPGTCPILFGMDLCSFSQPLIITEGQLDTLSLAEAGATNVVSVPSGSSNLEWIESCYDWLEHFREIILFGDADDPGRKMVRDVAKRLGEARCLVVEDYPEYADGKVCKDANEIIFRLGPAVLMDTLASAEPMPIRGVIQLADVIPYDPTTVPRIKTMVPKLDATIGGLVEGGLTVFTGRPSDGKSTLAGQLLLNAIEQGHSVCAYSGE